MTEQMMLVNLLKQVRLQSLLFACGGCRYQGAKHECKSSRWLPKHWDFLPPGIKEEEGNSLRSVYCLLCLSMGSTIPSLPFLLVNTVVLPVSRMPVSDCTMKIKNSWKPGLSYLPSLLPW